MVMDRIIHLCMMFATQALFCLLFGAYFSQSRLVHIISLRLGNPVLQKQEDKGVRLNVYRICYAYAN